MEAFAPVKQPWFFIGDSLESSDAKIELHYVWKIKEEHGRFNRAITTVADAALYSDGCLKVKVKSSMARSLPVENLLPQNVGSIINYLQ